MQRRNAISSAQVFGGRNFSEHVIRVFEGVRTYEHGLRFPFGAVFLNTIAVQNQIGLSRDHYVSKARVADVVAAAPVHIGAGGFPQFLGGEGTV